MREATCSILKRAGFSVLQAADAAEAVQVYEQSERTIDLLIADMVLPGRTGQQLGEDLRQRAPHLKILITSGYSADEYDIEDPVAHMYFLAKPYSRRSLIEKAEKILVPGHNSIQAS